MKNGIVGVRASGPPFQIHETIIGRIAVQMARHHAFRAITDKRFQYELMNQLRSRLAVPGYRDTSMAAVRSLLLE